MSNMANKKSEEMKQRERDKRSMLYGILVMSALFIIASFLLIVSFTGGGEASICNAVDVIRYHLGEIWEGIWFKISNFLDFLKRGFVS